MAGMRTWAFACGCFLVAGAVAARGQAGLPASIGRQTLAESDARRSLNAGTAGAELPEAAGHIGATVRLLVAGPVGDEARAVAEGAGLLRPDALFCTGDMVAGKAGGAERYTQEMKGFRGEADRLSFPWYPCVGRAEVEGGEAMAGLYQRYLGPRYYSVDVGAVHVMVLDSEEGAAGVSEGQLAWLRGDLKRTFLQGQVRQVVVLLHRALWQDRESAWKRAHDLLVDFNEHPIVTVEGAGGAGGGELRGPRVVAVLAGVGANGGGEYAMEPGVDGIGYFVLGPAGGEERGRVEIHGPAGRGVALLTLEEGDKPLTLARVALRGEAGMATLQPGDVVTAADRARSEAVRAWGDAAAGVDGALEGPQGVVRVHVANTLEVPVEVRVRVRESEGHKEGSLAASLGGAGWSDSAWVAATAVPVTRVGPGAKGAVEVALSHAGGMANVEGPVVEIVVGWQDSRGRRWEAVLPRRVPLRGASATRPAVK
jgi:hypothetical protein